MTGPSDPIDRALAAAPPTAIVRTAGAHDVPELARLINTAFVIERFFKRGDRTTVEEIRGLRERGEFLIAERQQGTALGCVYCTRHGEDGYFGMLSIDPTHQGRGLGRLLIDAVEARSRAAGCPRMKIHIVNLREELPPFYRRLGYVETGTLPFPTPEEATRPCHFIVMTKTLD
jgi:GNAT superfamily N-acetyltransferase